MNKSTAILAISLMMLATACPAPAFGSEAPGIEIVGQPHHTIKVRAGGVEIEISGDAQQHVAIYALTGQVVKQFDADPGSLSIDLPSGYYIVRVGHTSVKIAVK